MDQLILIVMLRENVLAKSTFLETNVMNLNQDIITSLIPNVRKNDCLFQRVSGNHLSSL